MVPLGLLHGVRDNKLMSMKKKVQVVIAGLDKSSGTYKILLLMTNEKRGSFWQNVTGSVEKNESEEAAALREVMEETGLKLEDVVDLIDLKLIHHFTDSRDKKCQEYSFLLITDKQWKIKIDPHEHQESHWCEIDKLSIHSVKYDTNWETLQKAIKLIKRYVV